MNLILALFVTLSSGDVFTEDLHSPDGLAFFPEGTVYVAEETAGRVSGLSPGGTRFTVLDDLSSPEGIAWDPSFGILVVEDVPQGRLISSAKGVLQESIPNPEGVTVANDGTVYYTWARHGGPSGICAWDPQGPDTVLTLPVGFMLSGIIQGPDLMLYSCIETPLVSRFVSVIQVDPSTGDWLPYAAGIASAEGLRFSPDGETLMVASESTGQVVAVDRNGEVMICIEVGSSIEDIIFLPDGSMLVSSDETGEILRFPFDR